MQIEEYTNEDGVKYRVLSIYFSDLIENIQKDLLKFMGITEEESNFDITPFAVFNMPEDD